jgi:type II secretory pathway pseudopilin PulG
MLIVVSILLIITVAVVAVAPRFTDDRKLSRAADGLAQWLLTVKQRAKRDQIPTGVRLFPDPQHNNLITQLQYIQQPDDFSVGKITLGQTILPAGLPHWPPPNWPPTYWAYPVLVAQAYVDPATGLPTVDFTGGFNDPTLWPVQGSIDQRPTAPQPPTLPGQPGDYLEVKGALHQILYVVPSTPSALILAPVAPFQPPNSPGPGPVMNSLTLTNYAQLASGMRVTGPWADPSTNMNPNTTNTIKSVNNTKSPQYITLKNPPGPGGDWIGFLPASVSSQPTAYNIIRQPRVLSGETPLLLPEGICIDPSAKIYQDPYAFAPPLDIMFSPQGQVMNLRGQDRAILWVRDYTKDYPNNPGEQFLIQIQTHTGFIAEHPVDTSSGNPYTFTQDARSSGL